MNPVPGAAHEKRIYLIGRFDRELRDSAKLGAAVRSGDVTSDVTQRHACCSLAGGSDQYWAIFLSPAAAPGEVTGI
jgi:hypothetical protein